MKVLWQEGMFLTPHHLQAWERAQREELEGRIQSLPVSPWGLLSLDIDATALEGGRLKVRSIQAVLKDGTWLEHTEEHGLLERGLPTSPGEAEISVSVALPRLHERMSNVAQEGTPAAATARYRVAEKDVADTHGGAEPQMVQFLRHAPRLELGRDPSDGMVRLEIARLRRDATGAWVLSDQFVPRVAHAATSPILRRMLEDLVVELQSRRRAVADQLRAVEARDVTSSNVFTFWMLHTLSGAIARIEHVASLEHASPDRWFEALRTLAGELTTFQPERTPSDLPVYNANELYGCFSELLTAIRGLMGQDAPADYLDLPLTFQDPFWQGDLPPDPRLANATYYLVLVGPDANRPLTEDAVRAIKVAAPDEVERIVRMKLVGVGLRELSSPPRGAPKLRDARFLELRASGLTWRKVAEGGAVAIHVPATIPTRSVALIAVP